MHGSCSLAPGPTAHRLLAALGRLLYCTDAIGTLAATLGAGPTLVRLLGSAAKSERDLILQIQLVLPSD